MACSKPAELIDMRPEVRSLIWAVVSCGLDVWAQRAGQKRQYNFKTTRQTHTKLRKKTARRLPKPRRAPKPW